MADLETNKATKEEVANALDGSPKGAYATVTDLQTAFPTGATGIYIVQADGHIYSWDGTSWVDRGLYQAQGIADGSVTTAKRTLLGDVGYIATSVPINIDTVNKKIIFASGFTYIFYRNQFINLGTAAFEVAYTGTGGAFFFDTATSTFSVGGAGLGKETSILLGFIYPNAQSVNARYLVNGEDSYVGNLPSTKRTVLGDNGFVSTNGYVDVDFTNKKITLPSGNKYIFYRNQFITLSTDIIEVTATTFSGVLFYDISLALFKIGSAGSLNENCILLGYLYPNAQVFNFPHTVSGKMKFPNESVTKAMLDFDPSADITVVSKLSGQSGVTFGDSITAYDGTTFSTTHVESGTLVKGYQSYMREELGCTVDNEGHGGADMPSILNNKILPYDFTGIDFVTMTSGANDHRLGTAVGTIAPIGSTFDTTTYAGALQSAIEHIIGINPLIKIYLMTPIRGWYNEYNTTNVPNTDPNAVGVLSEAYPNALKEVGELYGIPVCDWYNLTGFNDLNVHTYIGDRVDIPYYLHPKNVGYERMASVLIPFLNNN